MAPMQLTSHDTTIAVMDKRLEELEKRYADEKELLMKERNRLRAAQNHERGMVLLQDYSCVKKMHYMTCDKTIFAKTKGIKHDLYMIAEFVHLMEHLKEDFEDDRTLVRLDEERGDGYEVYVFEYRRVFDWDGFYGAYPYFDRDGNTDIYREGRPYFKKELKPKDYKFLTRDGGLTFEMFEGVIDVKDIVSA